MADAPAVSVEVEDDAVLNVAFPTKLPRRRFDLCMDRRDRRQEQHDEHAQDAAHLHSPCVMARSAREARTLTMERR